MRIGQSAEAVEYTDSFWLFSVLDTTLSDGEVPVMLELQGMRSTPSLPSLPASSTLARSDSTWLGPICWSNRTKLSTYAKLNNLK